jgi:hypothetical protein
VEADAAKVSAPGFYVPTELQVKQVWQASPKQVLAEIAMRRPLGYDSL